MGFALGALKGPNPICVVCGGFQAIPEGVFGEALGVPVRSLGFPGGIPCESLVVPVGLVEVAGRSQGEPWVPWSFPWGF